MTLTHSEITPLTKRIIGCAIEVHRTLGPGLLESIYEECLGMELRDAGCIVDQQPRLKVRYKGKTLSASYRPDLVVDSLVLLEVKSVERLIAVHRAQLLTYMKLTGTQVGLLLNFNTATMRDGIKRVSL